MSDARPCEDCKRVRPAEAFYKTLCGAERSARCRDCIETRVEAYRADKERKRAEEDTELEEFFSLSFGRPIPGHLEAAFNRAARDPSTKHHRPKLSNRPQMVRCLGCGDRVPKRELWEYMRGRRARYCKPCMRRRFVERECDDCGETKLTSEFREGLNGVSRHCTACRDKRTREKHCPRCDTTKSVADFGQSGGRSLGWCKQCRVDNQRERRAVARLEKR